MNIVPRAQMVGDLKPLGPAHFPGAAGARDLLSPPRPALPTSASVVRFDPGVRNHWHSHEGGQLLYVIEGEGWVQARGAAAQRIQVGDAVVTRPREEHWHGTGRSGPMAHLVVNAGETRWLEASPGPAE